MENLKVCIFAVFLIFGFIIASESGTFWFVLYLLAAGIIFGTYKLIRWLIRYMKEPIHIYIYDNSKKK